MAEPIPVVAAKRIAARYGYDQVVIVARKCGEGGVEHVTTYGRDEEHCSVAARIGEFFKHELMGWPRLAQTVPQEPAKTRTCVLHPSGRCGCGIPDETEGM